MSFESKMYLMLNQARYGKRFAKSCKDESEAKFFEELIILIENFINDFKKLKNSNKNEN